MWCWCSVCPHRATVNLLQLASTQCGVGPVCVPIELLSTYFNLPQPSVVLVQCVSPQSYCQPTSTCLNPVWCWSSVCPHRAIVNLLEPASTQCGVGPMCIPIELLSTYYYYYFLTVPNPGRSIVVSRPALSVIKVAFMALGGSTFMVTAGSKACF